jgi:hypothetical protein
MSAKKVKKRKGKVSVKKKDSKKATSNFVASVLLVTFVVVIIVIVSLWGRNYVLERAEKEGALSEKQLECTDIAIKVESLNIQGDNALIVIKNLADTKISKLSFRLEGIDSGVTESFEALSDLAVKEYTIELTPPEALSLDKIEVIPWLKVAEGYFVPCSNKKVTALIK